MGAAGRKQRGFLLAEFVVGLGLSSVFAAIVVSSIYQLNRASTNGEATLEVLTEVQKAAVWVTRDVRKASSSNLTDGGGAVSSASFSWIDSGGASHSCSYALSGTQLQRTCDGSPSVAARAVSGLSFSRSGSLVSVGFTVTPAERPSYAETVSLRVAMRAR
ncbi:MAG: hypothetical protein HY678_12505 [Chloroflexi bacterium]|nr:hypothetical protein [Chloroflexota bacterium]